MNYQLGDFIIRIKNACLAKRRKVLLAYSKINKEIGKVLIKEGFLEEIREIKEGGKKALEATIKYEMRRPVLTDVSLFSKPSLRIYAKAKNITKEKKGSLGVSILSTSHGVMTEKEARKKGVGGELLFKIW